MDNLLRLYRTQIGVLREWRGGPVALAKRLVIVLLVSVLAFLITAWLDPFVVLQSPIGAVEIVLLMALLNALVRPVLLAFVAPRSLIATGILVLVAQVVVFFVAARIAPNVYVDTIFHAVLASFIFAIVTVVLTAIVGVDTSDSFYGLLIQRLLLQREVPHSDRPGVVIMQIDGLAYPILAARIRAGSVNTMARWLRNGTHELSRWEALLPSMTSASQAGILHGNNDGIPAFRWYERDRQHLMVSSNPQDAAEIVHRVSNGEGLLSNDGVSICNLVTGDATRSYLTTAALAHGSKGIGESKAFLGFFFSPTGYLRSLTLFLGEFIKEQYQARRTRRSGVVPQMHRGLKYAGMRAASNVLLRDVNVSLVIEEMYRGANVIYADFTDYDELAHHCGPERVESFDALDGIDRALATLEKAAANAPRPYRFVVLSDHGQSLGATFKQRYGKTLGEVVRDLMGGRAHVVELEARAEDGAFVNSFLSEFRQARGIVPGLARAALAGRTTDDGHVQVGEVDVPPPADAASVAVVGSGNLGLIWFTGHDHRLTFREIEAIHPDLVERLANHPGVSMLLVNTRDDGGLVLGHGGAIYLDDGRVDGVDPTAPFGPHTLMSLRRIHEMPHAPDILVISEYNPVLGEVAAFEELIGSHGGLGGPQTEPFILHPVEWRLDEEVPLGAPAVYRNLRRWLGEIGIELGPQGAPVPITKPAAPPEPTPAPAGA